MSYTPSLKDHERFLKLKTRCVEIIEEMISFAPKASRFISSKESVIEQDIQKLRLLIDRTESDLLTLALFGSFSSGKSFLVSSLVGHLDWCPTEINGDVRDIFIPLIPSSPKQTSNCPLSVEPAGSEFSEDMFLVQFDDSLEWEPKPINFSSIQAYVTDLDDGPINRLREDYRRDVSQAKLLVNDSEIKARLYDLPGIGTAGAKYTNIVYASLQKADCIIFIASAEKPMGEEQLKLLRYVYDHYKDTLKPVFFVLTQIDTKDHELDYFSGNRKPKPKWEIVLEANNKILEEYFRLDGRPDKGFIGQKFIPISAAWDAKGKGLIKEGDQVQGEKLRAKSRMHLLRQELMKYLSTTSGPIHLTEILGEAERILLQIVNDLNRIENAEAIDILEVQDELELKKKHINELIDGQKLLSREVFENGEDAINQAFLYSEPSGLAKQLRQELSEFINSQDVLHIKIIHQLELRRAQIIRNWFNRPENGATTLWSQKWKTLEKETAYRAREILHKVDTKKENVKKLNDNDLAKNIAAMPEYHTSQDTVGETVRMARDIWPTVAGLGVSGALTGLVGGVAAIGPAGWAAIVTAAVAGLVVHRNQKIIREKRRQDMLLELNKLAEEAVSKYREKLQKAVSDLATAYNIIIDGEMRSTRQAIYALENRLATPESQAKQSLIEDIQAVLEIWEKIHQKNATLKQELRSGKINQISL